MVMDLQTDSLAFQGRNRLEEVACGVLVGGYGYVRFSERRDLLGNKGVCERADGVVGIFFVYLTD